MNAAVHTDLDVVVVTYRSAATIDECLARLLAADRVGRILAVDNASDDGTLAKLQTLAAAEPRLCFVANPGNRGFAAACNQGAQGGHAPWIAFVNPDCLVERDTFARLLAHADARPGLGLLGADLVDADGVRDVSARRREPSLAAMFGGAGRRGSVALPIDARLALQSVDAISGALMLMPRALFARLGGFDEGYRLHAEDLDLCRRVREAGHGVYVANDVSVTHLRGVSSRTRPLWVEWQKHRGLWRYFGKFEGRAAHPTKRMVAFAAICAHFVLAAPRAWWRARQA